MTEAAPELSELDDYTFANRWRDMPQEEKSLLPLAQRAEAVKRFRSLTAYIDDSISRIEAVQKRIDARIGEPEPTPSQIQDNLIDWSELAGDPPDFAWLMDHWLSWHPTLLAGRGGIGKSLLIQQVGTALACGMATWLEPSAPVRVLYWACEDDKDQLWRREHAICRQMKIGFDKLENFHVDARHGLENTLMTTEYGRPMWTPQIEQLRQQVNDLNIDVLALDNLGHTFGANENVRHDVTRFVSGVAGIVVGRPFCPIFLGHPSKQAGSEYSGSTAWENAVRMRWYLNDKMPDQHNGDDAPLDPDIRILAKRKTNYTALDYVRFKFDQGLLVAEKSETGDSGLMKLLREKKARSVILSAVPKLAEVGVYCNDLVGRNYLPSVVLNNKLSEGCSKTELSDAMRAMIMAKELTRDVVGKNSAYKPILGLVVSATI